VITIKYKLICIDMDGTLLNSEHKISENTKDAIRKAHNIGVHIVVSTGRLFADAESFSELIGVKSPIIASNGAVIRGIEKNDIIYKSVINEEVCLKLMNIFKNYDVKPCLYTPEHVYSRSLRLMLFYGFLKLKRIMSKDTQFQYIHSWSRLKKIIQLEKCNIVKCEILSKNKDRIKEIRKVLESMEEIEIVSSSKYNIEITNKGVSKGKGIEILSSCFKISKNEIIAIGDSENDLSMIEYAGCGIAMGNAIDSVKKRASYITDSNDNDGVAKAIKKFVLENDD
jgi:Cof subfamily protein (haloacid dehalogenase superfamily)